MSLDNSRVKMKSLEREHGRNPALFGWGSTLWNLDGKVRISGRDTCRKKKKKEQQRARALVPSAPSPHSCCLPKKISAGILSVAFLVLSSSPSRSTWKLTLRLRYTSNTSRAGVDHSINHVTTLVGLRSPHLSANSRHSHISAAHLATQREALWDDELILIIF